MAASEELNVLLRISQVGLAQFQQAASAVAKSFTALVGASAVGGKSNSASVLKQIEEWQKSHPGIFKSVKDDILATDKVAVGFWSRMRLNLRSMKKEWSGSGGSDLSFLLRGGAALGIANLASRAAGSLTSIRDTRIAVGSGDKSKGELWEETMRAIPFFGQGWELGRAIREQFDGTVQAAIDIGKAQRLVNIELEKSNILLEKTRAAMAAVKSVEQQGIDDSIVGATINPFERRRLQAQFAFDDAAKESEKALAENIITGSAFDRAMAGLRKTLNVQLAEITRESSDEALQVFRDGNAAMEQRAKDEEIARRIGALTGREAAAQSRLDGIDATIAGIDERAGVGRAGFFTRGSAEAERVQQDIATKRAEAADRKLLMEQQKKATDELAAIRSLIEIIRPGGTGTPFIGLE